MQSHRYQEQIFEGEPVVSSSGYGSTAYPSTGGQPFYPQQRSVYSQRTPLTQMAPGATDQRLGSAQATSQYTTTATSQHAGDYSAQMRGQSSLIAGAPQMRQSTTARSVSEMSRVIGHEYGQERVVSITQHVDESKSHIVNERYIEHEVRVPKKIVREEVIEKTVVIPERILQEEYLEETAMVREKIIEIAHPIIVEKIVEVPVYEHVQKVIEVPQIIKQDRIQHVEKVEFQERVQERVKVIQQERIVEVPEVQYRDVPVERVVEVAEWRDEVRTHEIPVPQYVEKPVESVVQVDQAVDVERIIPVPVEAEITYEFHIPRIQPRYHKITYPVYLPRFIEVPVNIELLRGELLRETEMYLQQVGALTKAAAALCDIENLATTIMRADLSSTVASASGDLQSIIINKWKEGTLNVQGSVY